MLTKTQTLESGDPAATVAVDEAAGGDDDDDPDAAFEVVDVRSEIFRIKEQGSILQSSFPAENFSVKFLSSKFGQISTKKYRYKFILKHFKAMQGHNYKLKFDQIRFYP
jgi:hypothetical protein